MRSRIIWTTLASGVVLIGVGMMQFRLTALQEPGPLETRIANQAKHFTIRRASSHGIPPRPVDTKASRDDTSALHGTGGDKNVLLPVGNELWPGAALLGLRVKVLENGMPSSFRRFTEAGVGAVNSRTEELAQFIASERYGFSNEG